MTEVRFVETDSIKGCYLIGFTLTLDTRTRTVFDINYAVQFAIFTFTHIINVALCEDVKTEVIVDESI